MASSLNMIPDCVGLSELDRVENAMREDDSDEETVDIVGDNDEDTRSNPHTQHDPSSSSTQQYPSHFQP